MFVGKAEKNSKSSTRGYTRLTHKDLRTVQMFARDKRSSLLHESLQ